MTMTTTSPTRSTPRWQDSRPDCWSPTWFPPPQWGTPRNPTVKTYGTAAAIVADVKLGRPLLPWQRHVADVALEIDPTTGRLAYRQVVVTVPRQSGKTTGLLFPVMVLRCLKFGRRQRIVYTAQDRNSAREKFSEEFVPMLRESPGLAEGRDFKVREANGSEAIEFLATGSTIKISATLSSSGHGRTLDMPGIDEAFEHQTTDVEQGFRVPMITRAEPQLWVVSTAGDERSTYLERKRESGRRSVERPGSVPGVAYFEWSADTEELGGKDADLFDRALWWRVMPALGHTITEAAIATEIADMEPGDARRAYLNVTQHRMADDPPPIDPDLWSGRVDRDAQHGDRMVYGVDVGPDGRAAVGVAGNRVAGGWLVEVIDCRPGTRWVPQFVAEVMQRNGGVGVAVDPASAAGALIADFEALGIEVFKMTAQKHAQACGALAARVPTGELFHLGQPELDAAVAGGKKRHIGDGAWLWDRRSPEVVLPPVVAVTLAFGALLALPEPDNEVSVYADRGFVEW